MSLVVGGWLIDRSSARPECVGTAGRPGRDQGALGGAIDQGGGSDGHRPEAHQAPGAILGGPLPRHVLTQGGADGETLLLYIDGIEQWKHTSL